MERRITNIDLEKFVSSLLIVLHHYQQVYGIRFEYGLIILGETVRKPLRASEG